MGHHQPVKSYPGDPILIVSERFLSPMGFSYLPYSSQSRTLCQAIALPPLRSDVKGFNIFLNPCKPPIKIFILVEPCKPPIKRITTERKWLKL